MRLEDGARVDQHKRSLEGTRFKVCRSIYMREMRGPLATALRCRCVFSRGNICSFHLISHGCRIDLRVQRVQLSDINVRKDVLADGRSGRYARTGCAMSLAERPMIYLLRDDLLNSCICLR